MNLVMSCRTIIIVISVSSPNYICTFKIEKKLFILVFEISKYCKTLPCSFVETLLFSQKIFFPLKGQGVSKTISSL